MKKLNLFFLLGFFIILNTQTLQGQQKFSLEDYFVKNADLIMTGEVKKRKCRWDKDKKMIFSYFTVQCIEILKGPKLKQIVIKNAGGEVGDTGMDISTAAIFKIKEKILVFLKKKDGHTYSVVEAQNGKYTWKGDQKVNGCSGETFDQVFIDSLKTIIAKQNRADK